ncbi:ROX3 [[Candida] subhashii]|uniref:Mediator of RNA polymerase II transcription subunit 19 n=1 Tax=[Candida] subhashii TaxID=561895 RepID=A0A8J5QEW0_9ASCO|nr:ROX3 [[Candida] subhashii]KAG7660864.1 ROX3 [[Candida] subhashii]
MAPKQKSKKMDLGEFLADDSFGGSWADTEIDMGSVGVGLTTEAPIGNIAAGGSGWGEGDSSTSKWGGNDEGGFRSNRPERKEFPIPDVPPYKARIGNLPWEADEEKITRHFESRMQAQGIITDVGLPVDQETGKLRGFGFITFTERGLLEEALKLNYSEFLGRKIFVSVAAPPRNDAFDGDWRSGGRGPMKPRREEVDLDWGAARHSQAILPPRERGDRGGFERGERSERPPRREEPDLDWGSARHSHATLPPRERSDRGEFERGERSERPPRKQEPDLDWGAARSTRAALPPREDKPHHERPYRSKSNREEKELDWTRAPAQEHKPYRSKSNRAEPEFDWSRGQALPPRQSKAAASPVTPAKEKKEAPAGPQKSSYSVLAALEGDDDSEDEEEETVPSKEEDKEVEQLESATSKLSVGESNDDGWEVVHIYQPPKPTPIDNLLSIYGLEPIAKSLARTNPDGSKGVKLRKSYKNHIQDLPGKHQISSSKPIPPGLLDPNVGQNPDIIKQLDPELLNRALKFEKTPINGIPGFNTVDLAINDQQMLMRGDDMSENDEYGSKKNKRKKKVQNGVETKRQHI